MPDESKPALTLEHWAIVDALRYPPTLCQVTEELFEVSRSDLRIMLQARTKAADLIAALLPPREPFDA